MITSFVHSFVLFSSFRMDDERLIGPGRKHWRWRRRRRKRRVRWRQANLTSRFEHICKPNGSIKMFHVSCAYMFVWCRFLMSDIFLMSLHDHSICLYILCVWFAIVVPEFTLSFFFSMTHTHPNFTITYQLMFSSFFFLVWCDQCNSFKRDYTITSACTSI